MGESQILLEGTVPAALFYPRYVAGHQTVYGIPQKGDERLRMEVVPIARGGKVPAEEDILIPRVAGAKIRNPPLLMDEFGEIGSRERVILIIPQDQMVLEA